MSHADQRYYTSLSDNLVAFCRILRRKGIPLNPGEQRSALTALVSAGVRDRERFRLTLRLTLAKTPREQVIFDREFDRYWKVWERAADWAPPAEETAEERSRAKKPEAKPAFLMLRDWLNQRKSDREKSTDLAAYSPAEALGKKDFARISQGDLHRLEDEIRRIGRALATQQQRRRKPAARGERIDLRRTLRRNLTRGLDLHQLAYRQPANLKPRLLVFADVSRSMDLYTHFLLHLLLALHRRTGKIETFTLGTRLHRLTSLLRNPRAEVILDQLSERVPDWSGGTRIGRCLQTFNEDYAKLILRPSTVVLIISDGWETGDMDVMDRALAHLQRRSRYLIWLNPLMGNRNFAPETIGMKTALPYIDTLHPCHNLESLRRLARLLLSNPVRGRVTQRTKQTKISHERTLVDS